MGLGRSLYFSGLSSVAKVVLQFGLSIFVARLLTPTEIGSYGVALAASALVRAFESAGINNFVASYKTLDRPLLHTVFTVNSGLNILLALILVVAAVPLGHFYGSDEVTSLILLLALATAANTHLPILQGRLRREMRFKALLKLELVIITLTSATTVAAILMGYGALSLAYAVIAERLVTGVLGLTLYRKEVPVALRTAEAGTVLRYGFALSTASVIGIVGVNASNFILGRTLGLGPSAQFDRGYTLPRLIWQVVQPSFHNVLVPEVARRDREGGDSSAIVAEVTGAFAMLVWPAGLVLVLLSPEIVLLLFGDQWQLAAGVAPWLLLYGLLVSPLTLAATPLIAFGHGRALITLQIIENGVKIPLLLLAGLVGIQGLTYLMALPALAYCGSVLFILRRKRLVAIGGLLRAFTGPLRLTVISVVPTLVVLWRADGSALGIGHLFLIAGMSAVLYLGGLWVLERSFLTRVMALLRPGKAAA